MGESAKDVEIKLAEALWSTVSIDPAELDVEEKSRVERYWKEITAGWDAEEKRKFPLMNLQKTYAGYLNLCRAYGIDWMEVDFREEIDPFKPIRENLFLLENVIRRKQRKPPVEYVEAHVKFEVERKAGEYWANMMYNGVLILGKPFDKFSLLLDYLESGEEHVDLYYTMMRQIGDEEMVLEELKRYPAPFNTKQMVRAYWTMDDVTWDYASREDYRIWKTTYSEAELTALTVDRLKRIAKVKLGKTYPTKRELIDAILGRTIDVIAEEALKEIMEL